MSLVGGFGKFLMTKKDTPMSMIFGVPKKARIGAMFLVDQFLIRYKLRPDVVKFWSMFLELMKIKRQKEEGRKSLF